MDKRDVSHLFRARLRDLLDRDPGSTATFLRDSGLDRSALSQFLNEDSVRLPRAETLRQIAVARGVSIDWLLGLENAPDGRQSISSRVTVEQPAEGEPAVVEKWRAEAEGHKLRYVPSMIPDMLNLQYLDGVIPEAEDFHDLVGERVLYGMMPGDMDIEIAMPIQTIESLHAGTGLWQDQPAEDRRRQLAFMARICRAAYPELRLHLYDGRQTFSAPFTVFGRMRAAIYIGDAYLELTNSKEIRAFVRRFDELVRQSVVSSYQAGELLARLGGDL